ncbi:MAG: hypothetical protein HYR85_13945 [Planctomycetes bacterium]|nr:hypothetical protein [Planctomycetota bacterium]MBI3843587.1 hypothetical protein [Planctomycetota bacterium]
MHTERRCGRCGLRTETPHEVVFNVNGHLHAESYCGRCWLILDGRPRGPYHFGDESFRDVDLPGLDQEPGPPLTS